MNINENIFEQLKEQFNLESVQNYNPLYSKINGLSNSLDILKENDVTSNEQNFVRVNKKISENEYEVTILDKNSGKEQNEYIFIKFSPLLNPLGYLTGKYNHEDPKLFTLPNIGKSQLSHEKMNDLNNNAYLDSFYCYLTSKLKKRGFVHGLNFYGELLAVKNNYIINIADDLSYVDKSSFFSKYYNKLFSVQSMDGMDFAFNLNQTSNKFKEKLSIGGSFKNMKSEVLDNTIFENIFCEEINSGENNELEEINSLKKTSLKSIGLRSSCSDSSGSTNSSRSSITTEENSDSECNSDDDFEDNSDDDFEDNSDEEGSDYNSDDNTSSQDEEEQTILATINKFPVQLIIMEKCNGTLDEYIEELMEIDHTSSKFIDLWKSILMQVIMMLITYQNVYNFTHNDLHTNNIMYVETNEKYLYYCYNEKYYKVPTYGKIFKIIDFGRAIYDYNGDNYCSDCFNKGEDAATQYNFGVYHNPKKPIITPNKSFDLCRLACSIFDFFVDSMDEVSDMRKTNKIANLIIGWCEDDKKRNILYKSDGEERYPDFKLYKMIARTVHNHIPEEQLDKSLFSNYKLDKIPIGKPIMNLNDY